MLHLLSSLLAAASAPLTGEFDARVRPVLERHCFGCHSGAEAERGLALDQLADRAGIESWTKVRARMIAGEMPPKGKPRPAPEDVRRVVDWIDASFFRLKDGSIDPGRPTLRRLNRTQYENTIRDLFGVDFPASRVFPEDDVGYGFDSVGDVLATSSVLFEKALKAAEAIANEASFLADREHPPVQRFEAAQLGTDSGSALHGQDLVMFAHSDARLKLEPPAQAGEYLVRVRAWGDQAGPEPARMALNLERRELARLDVRAVRAAPEVYEARVQLPDGARKLSATFVNDYYEPKDPDPAQRDRNLHVAWIEVVGPVDGGRPSAFQERWLRQPAADRRRVLSEVALRVWRRPATAAELDGLVQLAAPEAALPEAVRPALVALLVSPSFLFRVESDAGRPAPGGVRELDGWELATRLAYFLWSSTPDDELLEAARQAKLKEPAQVAAQVERMLRDGRASALSADFAEQWLQIRTLERAAPDPERFPQFDAPLRSAMRAETTLFFDAVLRERRPLHELLESDFTFVNEPLARHYGLAGVHGDEMRRVRLEPGRRNGLLGQASILTVTSNPTRTSPVKRGKWVLDVLLGAPPPPPPPGVGDLAEGGPAASSATLRERMLAHRKDPSCAACHGQLDPLGFGLENYDALGAWRERDGSLAIDATGTWPDGRSFAGPAELRRQIAADPRFVRNLARRLLVYAVGRGLTPADEPSIDALLASCKGPEATLVDLIQAVVRSDPFRKRRVQE